MFTPVSHPSDIRAVADLAKEIWTEHYNPIIGEAQVCYMLNRFQSTTAIQQQIDEGMRYVLFSQQSGYLAYTIKTDHLFLSKIYVHNTYRGQGLARQAIDWILATEKPERIRLTVNRHNTQSIAAYEKLGFKKAGTLITDIGNGYVMDDFVMVR